MYWSLNHMLQHLAKWVLQYLSHCFPHTHTFEVLLLALPFIMEKSTHPFKMESQKAAKCFQVFCNMSLCQWLSGSLHFKRLWCLNLHGSRHNDPSKHREPPTSPPLITRSHYKRLESSATPQPNLISWTAFKAKQITFTLRDAGTDTLNGKWWRNSLVTRPGHQIFHTTWHQSSMDWYT
jgi:hypothetical protein